MSGRVLSSALRERITLQQPVLVPDTGGGYSRTWQDVATTWAEVLPVTGRYPQENVLALQLEARTLARITLRYREDVVVRADMRVLHRGVAHNIRSVLRTGTKGERLELLVEAGGA